MYNNICIFKRKDCCPATVVDCSESYVVMEAVQALLKVAKLTNKLANLSALQGEICKSLHPFTN